MKSAICDRIKKTRVCEYHKRAATMARVIPALTDWHWSNQLVEELPARYERNIISSYTSKYQKNSVTANVWLRRVMQNITSCKIPFSAISSDDTAAAWGREQCKLIFTNNKGNFVVIDEVIARYRHVCKKVKQAGFEPLGADRKKLTIEQCQLFCSRMEREQWWARKAKTTAARVREYIAISLGFVSASADPYCSKETLQEWQKAQENAAAFMQSNFIGLEIETDAGFDDLILISLAEAAATSTADPEIRRLEMMARIRGIKEAATEKGWQADFVTWTAPGAYHVNAGAKKWNGADPKKTQKYLSKQWAKARAEIKAAGLQMAGMRVAEPHADATPHWHMLVFSPKDQAAAILGKMESYACQHDKAELEKKTKDGKNPRFHVEHIDPLKGCAVAYVAKYISKSINAAHMENDQDEETGRAIDNTTAQSVRAWASRWGIRQFQFFGAPPVTVWREMRRLSDPIADAKAEAIRIAAGEKGKKNASFKTFIQLMGGLCSAKADHPVKVLNETRQDSYGETKQKITGLTIIANGWELITRKNWLRLGAAAFAFVSDSARQGASRAARTRENNCKLTPEQINEKFADAVALRPAIAGYLDALGRWIVEKVTDYFKGDDYVWQ